MGMDKCKACGREFASTNPKDEICYPCENALKRLNGYAVPVVRCKDCEFCNYHPSSDTYKCCSMRGMYRAVLPEEFCSWGERKDNE